MILCYKFGYSIDYVCSLTIPQIVILEENLRKICEAEGGKESSSSGRSSEENEGNRLAFGETVKVLKKETGRKEFTLQEIMKPAETIKKYGNNSKSNS